MPFLYICLFHYYLFPQHFLALTLYSNFKGMRLCCETISPMLRDHLSPILVVIDDGPRYYTTLHSSQSRNSRRQVFECSCSAIAASTLADQLQTQVNRIDERELSGRACLTAINTHQGSLLFPFRILYLDKSFGIMAWLMYEVNGTHEWHGRK